MPKKIAIHKVKALKKVKAIHKGMFEIAVWRLISPYCHLTQLLIIQ
jgi:hypothetical protein